MGVHLAADGGQSGMRMAVVEDLGDELRLGEPVSVPGFSWAPDVDLAGAQHDAIVRAWRALGSPSPVEALACGLSGLPVPSDGATRLVELLTGTFGARHTAVAGDDLTTHAGALGGRPGVVLAAGTGVICTSVDAAGTPVRVDGLGYLLGDAGGGSWLGREGLRAALAGAEGRHRATELTDRAVARYGELREFVHRVLRSPTMVADVAAFARDVLAAAADGDPVARDLCRGATDELAATVTATVRAGYPDAAPATVPFAWTGSILTGSELVREPLLATLADRCPAVAPQPPAGGGLEGAAALAVGSAPAHLKLTSTNTAPN